MSRVRVQMGRTPAADGAIMGSRPNQILDINSMKPKNPKISNKAAGSDEAGDDHVGVNNQLPAQ